MAQHKTSRGRGSNLTMEDRRRGGRRSAKSQERGPRGRFAGHPNSKGIFGLGIEEY